MRFLVFLLEVLPLWNFNPKDNIGINLSNIIKSADKSRSDKINAITAPSPKRLPKT